MSTAGFSHQLPTLPPSFPPVLPFLSCFLVLSSFFPFSLSSSLPTPSFFGRVSVCTSDWSRTHYIFQAGLNLVEIYLPLLLSARIKGVCHHHLTSSWPPSSPSPLGTRGLGYTQKSGPSLQVEPERWLSR